MPRNRWPTCGPGAWEERQPSSCSTSSASWNTPSNPRRITCEPHRSTQTQHTHRDDSSLFTYVTSSQICLEERHFDTHPEVLLVPLPGRELPNDLCLEIQ